MARLQPALEATLGHEGFYSNDSQDTGGETLFGIARSMNPKWEGWRIVDSLRQEDGFPECMRYNSELIELRDEFYTKAFWNPMRGDEIINQDVASDLFDSSVNMGISQGIILCQRALGVPETGKMDNSTLNTLNSANPYA